MLQYDAVNLSLEHVPQSATLIGNFPNQLFGNDPNTFSYKYLVPFSKSEGFAGAASDGVGK